MGAWAKQNDDDMVGMWTIPRRDLDGFKLVISTPCSRAGFGIYTMMYSSASTIICQSKQGGSLHHHTMPSTWPDEANKAEAARARARVRNQGRYRLMTTAMADSLS